jgi:hypothetical protein
LRQLQDVGAQGSGPRADTNDVLLLPSIARATDASAPTLDLPLTTLTRVLVVDDQALYRIGLRQPLQQQELSDTARTALHRAAEQAPDVAVLGVDHRATRATRMSARGYAAALTIRRGGKPNAKRSYDSGRRDLTKSIVKRLVPEAPTSS